MPTIQFKTKIILVFLIFCVSATVAKAQIAPITGVEPGATSSAAPESQRGMGSPTIATQTASNSTNVLGSQSYTYMVPLLHLPGRNGFDLNMDLYYNSEIWPLNSNSTNADWDTPSLGFRLDYGFFTWGGVFMDPDGTKHPLTTVNDVDPRYYFHFATTDSSYIDIKGPKFTGVCPGPTNCQQPNLTVTWQNGRQGIYENFNYQNGGVTIWRPIQFTDTHGNQMPITYRNGTSLAISSITDSVGRVVNFSYDANGNLSSFGYGQHIFNFSWNTNYQVRFNFGSGLTTLPPISVLTGVIRPNGTSVAFKYGDWGIVNEIDELSASGNLRYSTAYNFPAASAGALSSNPTYTTQTVFDGVTHNLQWTYNATANTNGLVTAMAITNPNGVTTTNTFSSNGDAFDGMLLQQTITASNTTLRVLDQSWGLDGSGNNPRLTAVSTILENGAASGVQYVGYDTNGNLTDLKDFDFGSASSGNLTLAPGTMPTNLGPLLRETVTSYAALTGIANRPSQLFVKDGSGNTVSRTDYNYDEGSTTVHGDLTSMIRYPNAAAGTGGIKSTFTYDSYGNVLTVQQGCCTTTQMTFSSATNFAYPDSIANGPQGGQLTTSFTYNADGSKHNATDPNGVVTTYTYDAAGRITSVAQSPGITTNTSFDDASVNPSASESNTGNSLVTKRLVDGLGRLLSDQRLNGTAVVSTTTYTNDSLGRPVQISNPYGPSDTPLFTSVQYDPLGRVTQVTPPPVVSGGSQNSYAASYAGATVTFSDPATRQRVHYRDALGRLVRVDEPGLINGSFASGTVAVSGSEQSVPSTSASNGATAGTATVTISGAGPVGYTFCSMENQTCSFSGTMNVAYGANGSFIYKTGVSGSIACNNATFTDPAVGIVKACYINTVSGPYDRSYPVLTHAATPASLTVTIGGSDSTNTYTTTTCTRSGCTNHYFNSKDTGSISFSVNVGGTTIGPVSANYDGNSSTATLASTLYTNFPPNSLVSMSNPGGGSSFTLTTTAAGSVMNNTTFSSTMGTNCVTSDNQYCAGPGWTYTPAQSSFSNGSDNAYRTAVDTGNVTVTIAINGTNYSKTSAYAQGSTPSSVALDLYNKFNSDNSVSQVLRFTQPGTSGLASNVVGFTTVATGAGTNYPITISSATTDSDFQSGSTSYPITDSGSTFTPGQNGILYDNGTITLTVNGFTDSTAPGKTITYGQGTNAQGLASQFGALIHNDPSFPLDASVASGSTTINLTARDQGAAANSYTVTISGQSNLSSSFPAPSFASPAASVQLANGVDPAPSFDPTVVLSTLYSYNAMGDLVQVLQGQQTRSYSYDGLGQLTSSCIPEMRGQCETYSYTDFGAIQQKVDPRIVSGAHITTTYGFDALGHVNDIQYNEGTPEVKLTYGAQGAANYGAGRVISRSDGSGSQTFQYDPQGRVTQLSRTIGGIAYSINYVYTASGQLSSITYPSGRKVTSGYDAIDRLTSVSNNNSSLVNVTSYNAADQPLAMNYSNGVQGNFGFDNQLRLSSIQYLNSGGSLFNLLYNYGTNNDNGQIRGVTDNVNTNQSTSYTYDELGRLKTAQTTNLTAANTWKLVYTYDRYGNRRIQDPTAGTASVPLSETPIDPTSNHIIGYSYDAAGNLLSDGLHSYSWDAGNRLTQVDGTANTFVYDADDLRVKKNNTIYIFHKGKVIAEYASGAGVASPNIEYFYAGNKRVAAIANGVVTFGMADHLSTRLNTNASGGIVRTYGHFPFGETWYQTLGSDKWDFTTYERDQSSEGGLDYANARFDSTRIGRFVSLDPLSGDSGNPQSLNRYTYVNNDPINLTDTTGLGWDTDPTFLCLLDDKGDPTTTCASFGGAGSKDEAFFFDALVAQGFDADKSLKDTDPFKDLFADDPKKDPLTAAADQFDKDVQNLFAAVKAAEFLDQQIKAGKATLKGNDAIGYLLTFNNNVYFIGTGKYYSSDPIQSAAKDLGYTPPLSVKSIAQTRATNVDDTGKPYKLGGPPPTPKTSVAGSSNSSAQFQLRIPPSGAECFRADGWQLLLQTFWNPPGYLDPTSSSSTTCVK